MRPTTYWFAIKGKNLLLANDGGTPAVPLSDEMPTPQMPGTAIHDIGCLDGHGCKAYCIAGDDHPGLEECDLRSSYFIIGPSLYDMAAKASELVYWDMTTRYCPVCGSATEQTGKIEKVCPKCGHQIFPSISPAIIVLIQRGEEVLMVHARNFRGTFRGLVAGYVEPGESLEDCIKREVMEETGLTIKNVKYFGSQPWPYPSVLMVGFTAEYESGKLKLQDDELDAGCFFTIDNLPELPQKLSLARRLIDWWISQKTSPRHQDGEHL